MLTVASLLVRQIQELGRQSQRLRHVILTFQRPTPFAPPSRYIPRHWSLSKRHAKSGKLCFVSP
jgi:hypothetical protein